jgi:hypothetical protein
VMELDYGESYPKWPEIIGGLMITIMGSLG